MADEARFRIGTLDHVHLRVPNRAEAAAWYAEHLGFEPVQAYAFWAEGVDGGPLQISADGGETMLALFEANEHQPMVAQENGVAFSTDATTFIAFARSLPGAINSPQGAPLEANDLIDFDLCWAFDLSDPWGNRFELNCYDYDQIKHDLVDADDLSPVRYWPTGDYQRHVAATATEIADHVPGAEPAALDAIDVFIGSGCLVHDGRGKYLLVRETKASARHRFALPAGKLEPNESIPAAAIRETLEETGLVVELDGLIGVFHSALTNEGTYGVNFVFAATAVGGTLTPTDEHPELLWLTAAEIARLSANGGLRGPHAVEATRRFEAGVFVPGDVITTVAPSPTLSKQRSR